jgi:hypothetical protein
LLVVVHGQDIQESSIAFEKSYVSKPIILSEKKPKIRGGEK